MTKDGPPMRCSPIDSEQLPGRRNYISNRWFSVPNNSLCRYRISVSAGRRPNPVIEIFNANCFDGGLNYY